MKKHTRVCFFILYHSVNKCILSVVSVHVYNAHINKQTCVQLWTYWTYQHSHIHKHDHATLLEDIISRPYFHSGLSHGVRTRKTLLPNQ